MLTDSEFTYIYDTLYKDVFRYTYYRTYSIHDSEDITHDCFHILLERDIKYDLIYAKKLLFKIAKGFIVSKNRRHLIKERYLSSIEDYRDVPLSPDQLFQSVETLEMYNTALGNLPVKKRNTFILSRKFKMTYQEIADVQGVTIKAIEKRISETLEVLRGTLLMKD